VRLGTCFEIWRSVDLWRGPAWYCSSGRLISACFSVAVCFGMLLRAVLRALVLGMVLTRALGLGLKAGEVHHARFTSGSFAAHVLPDWSVVPLEGQCSEAPLATGV
jgi:hypothetical protein